MIVMPDLFRIRVRKYRLAGHIAECRPLDANLHTSGTDLREPRHRELRINANPHPLIAYSQNMREPFPVRLDRGVVGCD